MGTFSCVWRGICRSIGCKVVHQKVVVQFASSRHLVEWAISTGRRYQASSTCVRGNIFVRMEWRSTVDRARGGASEGCRTIRLQPPLSRVGDFDRPKSVGTFSCVSSSGASEGCRSRHLVEWAISTGRRYQASSTCVRGNIFVRMEKEFRTSRLGRSGPRWCIRRLSYNSPRAAT